MLQNTKKGFSMLEMIVVITITGIMIGIVSVMHTSHYRIFTQLQADSVNQSHKTIIVREFSSVMRNASAVLESRTFGSTLHTTSSNTVIVMLPALDAQGRTLSTADDYVVFYQDASNLNQFKMEIVPDASSSRKARTRVLTDSLKAINLRYNMSNPVLAEVIMLSLDLTQPYRLTEIVSHVEVSYDLGNQ